MAELQPYREPLRVTLVRTISIAVIGGAIVALSVHRLRLWPALIVILLWPSFGGHWIDLWYLNWLRPRLSAGRAMHLATRIAVWFVGGALLAVGVRVTMNALLVRPQLERLTWATAGLAFIAIELVAHAALYARGRPSFYNGLG
jgi:hypothetical protein